MCGANRSHSNKTTSRKFRKSVDSVSGPRTELNIAAIVTSLLYRSDSRFRSLGATEPKVELRMRFIVCEVTARASSC